LIWLTDEHILSEVLAEAATQRVKAASHVGACGTRRYAERLGDLPFGETAEETQRNCLPLAAGQFLEGAYEGHTDDGRLGCIERLRGYDRW
jgi:hypothetical protein